MTEQHYTQWLPKHGYANPWHVPEGGVPTDLFAALDSVRVTKVTLCVTKDPGREQNQ